MGNNNKTEYINISAILRSYWQHWLVFVISIIVCVILAIAYIGLTSPIFSISANILVKEDKKSGMGELQSMMMKNSPFGNMVGGNTSINDELQLIGSFTTIREVAKKMHLNEIYEENKFLRTASYYQNSPLILSPCKNIADTLGTPLKFKIEVNKAGKVIVINELGLLKKNKKIEASSFPIIMSTEYGDFKIDTTAFYKPGQAISIKVFYTGYDLAAETLQKEIAIDVVSKKANVISLSMVESNRQKGKDILNTLIQIYNENDARSKNELVGNTLSFLDERIALISNDLANIEKEIEVYKKENSLTDIETEAKIILDKSGDFKEKLIEAETQYTVIELVESFLLRPENRYALIPLNIGLNDRTVLEGLQQYNNALLERMRLLRTTHTDNPTVESTNDQVDAMRENMLATIRSIKNGFSHTQNNLEEQEKYFTSRIKGMPTQEREFINIKRQQMIKQELFVFLLQKKEENALALSITNPKVQIVDAAYSLSKPVKPKPNVILLISIFLGVALAITFVSLKNYINQHRC